MMKDASQPDICLMRDAGAFLISDTHSPTGVDEVRYMDDIVANVGNIRDDNLATRSAPKLGDFIKYPGFVSRAVVSEPRVL